MDLRRRGSRHRCRRFLRLPGVSVGPCPGARGKLGSTVVAAGTVRANQYSLLALKTGGNVGWVNVQVGDQVSAGEVLAELSPSSLSAQVILAPADLGEAQRGLEDLRTSDAARAASQLALAQARQAYDKAQRRD